MADRFCAWKGRSARRTIFSVFPLGPDTDVDDLPLDGGGVVLGVRRGDAGSRQVLWACASEAGDPPAGLRVALAALAIDRGEAHLHLLTLGEAAREQIVGDLGFPALASHRGVDRPQIAPTALGASMNPPDWRRHRSA